MLNKRQYSHKMQDSEMLGEKKKKKKRNKYWNEFKILHIHLYI